MSGNSTFVRLCEEWYFVRISRGMVRLLEYVGGMVCLLEYVRERYIC